MPYQLKNKCIDEYGRVSYNDKGLFDLLYSGETIQNYSASDTPEIKQFNKIMAEFDKEDKIIPTLENINVSLKEYDQKLQQIWLIPNEYKSFDILEYCLSQCKSQDEILRVEFEYSAFKNADWIHVLQLLKYLVDTMRKNNIVWGVGRGSSVSSFILFLLGIHKINPMTYNLNFSDFIKNASK